MIINPQRPKFDEYGNRTKNLKNIPLLVEPNFDRNNEVQQIASKLSQRNDKLKEKYKNKVNSKVKFMKNKANKGIVYGLELDVFYDIL